LLLSTVWTSCLTLFTTLQPVASVPAATNTAMRNPIRPRSDTPASSTETVLTVTGSPVRGYGTAACRRGISATGGPAGRRAGGPAGLVGRRWRGDGAIFNRHHFLAAP